MNIQHFLKKYPEIYLFKEYSGLILTVPTLSAGVLQSGILISINVDLLRFFSVSSLLKDGIILTSEFVILLLFSYIYRLLITRYVYKRYKDHLQTINIIITLVGFALLYISKLFVLENYAYIILFFIMFFYINNGIFIKRDFFSTSGIYIGQLFIVIMLNSLVAAFPNYQIRNIENLTIEVSKKHPKAKLLYFNDQYLFYSLKPFNPRDPKKDLLVVKIDEIFETYEKSSTK